MASPNQPTIFQKICPKCFNVFAYTKEDLVSFDDPNKKDKIFCGVICPFCQNPTNATFIKK